MQQYLTPGIYIKHLSTIGTKNIKNFASLFLSIGLQDNALKPIVLNSISEIGKFSFLTDDLLITKAIRVFFENGGKKLYLLSLFQNNRFDINHFRNYLSKNCDGLIDLETIVAIDIFDSNYLNKIIDLNETLSLQNEISRYCKNSFRISISDLPKDYSNEYLDNLIDTITYYPWVINNQNFKLPPSSYASGLFSKVAQEEGIYASIANKQLKNAIDVDEELDKEKLSELHKFGVNPLIKNTNEGVKIWGVRTLNHHVEIVNTLRIFNYVKRSIQNIAKWYLFEPNSQYLKEKLIRKFNNFLFKLWQEGNLKGSSQNEAYLIICDNSNNSAIDYNQGRLNIDVAISITKPLEFILINLRRIENGENQANIIIS